MKHLLSLMLLLLAGLPSFGATYYIDFAGGADANNGTTTGTPWKHHPYMAGWTGSYSHSAGDKFIFKGGVTWDHTCFPMAISSGGSSSSVRDYYGTNVTWFAGGSWTPWIFDAGGLATASGGNNRIISCGTGNLQIDGGTLTGYFWDSASQGFGSAMVNIGGNQHVLLSGILFTNWSHGTSGAGTIDSSTYGVLGITTQFPVDECISNCIFDGAPSATTSLAATYCIDAVKNSIARNMANGFIVAGNPFEVGYCTIGPINTSFDALAHENGIEDEGQTGSGSIHHTTLFQTTAACMELGDAVTNITVYDCLVSNVTTFPITLDSSINQTKSFTARIWNNTLDGTAASAVIRGGRGGTVTIVAQNNHIIGTPFNAGTATYANTWDHNYTNASLAAAAAQGYTSGNQFQPASSGAPTVNAGVDLSASFTTDLLQVSRPQGSAWDIGAYEFVSSTPGITGSTGMAARRGTLNFSRRR